MFEEVSNFVKSFMKHFDYPYMPFNEI